MERGGEADPVGKTETTEGEDKRAPQDCKGPSFDGCRQDWLNKFDNLVCEQRNGDEKAKQEADAHNKIKSTGRRCKVERLVEGFEEDLLNRGAEQVADTAADNKNDGNTKKTAAQLFYVVDKRFLCISRLRLITLFYYQRFFERLSYHRRNHREFA